MRLLYVIDSLAPGGAETSLAEMAPGLVARGIDLHVLPLSPRLDLAPRLEAAGTVLHLSQTSPYRIGNIRKVLDVARRVRPSLVHTTLFEADLAGRSAARILKIPSSTSIVSDSYGPSHYAESSSFRLNAARALDIVTASSARRFHAISEAIADSVSPRLRIPRASVDVIPRGRDPRALPFRPREVRANTRGALGIPASAKVILAIGRLEPPKGLHHLLAALPQVASAYPLLVVLIAGKEGRASQSLRSTAAQLGIDIRFLGHRNDVPALLAASDALCFPSEREGFGGVLVEALASGCPIVASSIPTTMEVLGRGEACPALLADPGDSDGLASALIETLAERRGAELRALRGRQRFDERFTIDGVVGRMAEFFAHVESD